jgi:2-isopropylmalate synthase
MAFTHKGGVHVHAINKHAYSYEHMDPALIGNCRGILVSELSGQSNVLAKVEALGLKLDKNSPEVARILREVKRLENEGYEFEAAEASFELLVAKEVDMHKPLFILNEYHCDYHHSPEGKYDNCEATIKLCIQGFEPEHTVAQGDGPINALDAALRKALRAHYPGIDQIVLQDYKVRIIDARQASAARTRVLITFTDGANIWTTVGASGNIIQASWLALVDGLERKLMGHVFEKRGSQDN